MKQIPGEVGQQMIDALREILNANGIDEAQILLLIARPGETPDSNCMIDWFTTSDDQDWLAGLLYDLAKQFTPAVN